MRLGSSHVENLKRTRTYLDGNNKVAAILQEIVRVDGYYSCLIWLCNVSKYRVYHTWRNNKRDEMKFLKLFKDNSLVILMTSSLGLLEIG